MGACCAYAALAVAPALGSALARPPTLACALMLALAPALAPDPLYIANQGRDDFGRIGPKKCVYEVGGCFIDG